jgi:hypothetical protein
VFGRTEKQQNNLINFRAVSGQRERALGGGDTGGAGVWVSSGLRLWERKTKRPRPGRPDMLAWRCPRCPGRRRCPRFLISSATTSRTLVGLTIGVAAIRFAARERRAAHRAHTRLTASGDSQTAGLTSAVRPSATLAVSGAQASMARQRDTVYRGRDTGYYHVLT